MKCAEPRWWNCSESNSQVWFSFRVNRQTREGSASAELMWDSPSLLSLQAAPGFIPPHPLDWAVTWVLFEPTADFSETFSFYQTLLSDAFGGISSSPFQPFRSFFLIPCVVLPVPFLEFPNDWKKWLDALFPPRKIILWGIKTTDIQRKRLPFHLWQNPTGFPIICNNSTCNADFYYSNTLWYLNVISSDGKGDRDMGIKVPVSPGANAFHSFQLKQCWYVGPVCGSRTLVDMLLSFYSIFPSFCDLKDKPCWLAPRKDRPSFMWFLAKMLPLIPGWLHNEVVGNIIL